jgi:hypothetical protein
MPNSRPVAPDMLAVIREWLEREILPGLADDRKFLMRVAVNMLATVERELRDGPALDIAETARLRALLGRDGALDELNRTLCAEIAAGRRGFDDAALVQHLRQSLATALAVNNPKWSGAQS